MMKNKVLVSADAYGKTKGSLGYWRNHRNKLDELYKSERFFLEPALKQVTSVLDIGCAAGGSYNFCKEANNSIKYKGIDISNNLIQIAKSRYPKVDFLHYDGKTIPFKENEFDLVFSIGVLHHLLHWKEMIKNIVSCCNQFAIFDLRLTSNETLFDSSKYFQKIAFGEKWDNQTVIPYIVINAQEFINFITETFDNGSPRVQSYGYYSKPTHLSNIPYEKIYMCCLQIKKYSKNPGVFVDLQDN